MAVYVVTGGAGFIGSHIVEELIRRNERVRVIDNFSTGKRENIDPFRNDIEVVEADLANDQNLARHLRGADYVIHQAAIPSVPLSIREPVRCHQANVNGTLNVLTASVEAGVKRVVYASSSALYGEDPELPKREDMKPSPVSPYGAQKLFGEMYCQVFTRSYGLETVSLRYFNIFGPRQDASSQYSGVLALFISAVLEGRRPTIFGDGNQSRDFTYVQNVVEANLLACTAPNAAGQALNVACGISISVNTMLAEINRVTNRKIDPIYAEARAGDIQHSHADITLAGKRLAYKPTISFEEGLQRTIAWYKMRLLG